MASEDNLPYLGSKLKLLRSENVLTDVVIKCGHLLFPAHRVVLAASSLYFRAMFTEDMKEKMAEEVEINTDDPEAMMKILEYMYTEQIDITRDTGAILGAAEYLQVDVVSNLCCEYLLQPDSVGEAFEAWVALDLYKKDKKEPILLYLASKLDEVCLTPEFLNLDISHLEELLKITEETYIHQDVECKFEFDVRLEGAMRWAKFDLENRKPLIPSIIDLIGLSKISPGYLVNLFETESWLIQIPSVALKIIAQITTNLWERKTITVCLNFQQMNLLEVECIRYIDFLMYYFLPKQTLKIPYENLTKENVNKVCSDNCRIIFITNDWYVVIYNLETGIWDRQKITLPEDYLTQNGFFDCEISHGYLYLLNEQQLYQCNIRGFGEITEKALPILSVEDKNEILADVNGILSLVGGEKGFQMFNVETNEWHIVRFKFHNNSLKLLKKKKFLCQNKENSLYIITKDFLTLYVVTVTKDFTATLQMVKLPLPAVQPTPLSFEVFCLSSKRDRYKFFFLDSDGNIWNRMTGPKFEKWRKNECCCNHGNLSLSKIQYIAVVSMHCDGNYQMKEKKINV